MEYESNVGDFLVVFQLEMMGSDRTGKEALVVGLARNYQFI